MPRLSYYVRRDSDGTYAGEGSEEGDRVSLAAVQARLGAGLTALDAATNARPPARPAPVDPFAPKRTRLAALRAKGWANLTLAEKEEARGLRFDLGGDAG